jgi:hypothetical protein
MPILFEESYIKQITDMDSNNNVVYDYENTDNNYNNDYYKNQYDSEPLIDNIHALHLIVLVHGYQANAYDMRMIKDVLANINSSLVFLCSSANQDDTECGIEEMGLKLANEVKGFIKEINSDLIYKR